MIELLFTTSNHQFSRLARWAMQSDCSHFAINLDNGIVFHSNFLGAHIEPYCTFMQNNTTIHRLKFNPLDPKVEENIYQKLIRCNYGKWYDMGAMIYLGFSMILHRGLGRPIPKKNLWNSQEQFICTELLGTLADVDLGYAIFPQIEHITMKRPHDLFESLSKLSYLRPS